MTRVYTVDEATALPPPGVEELELRSAALALMEKAAGRILAERSGVPFSIEEILALLDRNEGDPTESTPKGGECWTLRLRQLPSFRRS